MLNKTLKMKSFALNCIKYFNYKNETPIPHRKQNSIFEKLKYSNSKKI